VTSCDRVPGADRPGPDGCASGAGQVCSGDWVLRPARPADYDGIAAVVDDWWGRPVRASLPRLFLDHFHATSLIAERRHGPVSRPDSGPISVTGHAPGLSSGDLAGFLIGFPSPSLPDEAYIHFVGVHPEARGSGLARTLYESFFTLARDHGRRVVRAITAPVNTASIAFHRKMGFTVSGPVPGYNGPGTSLITFSRFL